MGLGPVHAATPILKRNGLGLNDLETWEMNEAFAAQVLGCLAAWKDESFCRENLGLDGALGELDRRSSTSMAARSRSAIRSAQRHPHRAASGTCQANRRQDAASPPNASAAGRAARC